jgi:hypothetical protein
MPEFFLGRVEDPDRKLVSSSYAWFCFAVLASSFFAWPKNEPKKASPLLALRVPCASRYIRALRNSLRSNSRRANPNISAMLGVAKGRIGSFP